MDERTIKNIVKVLLKGFMVPLRIILKEYMGDLKKSVRYIADEQEE